MYINPVVPGKRTLGSISCIHYNISFTPTEPSQLSTLGVTPGLRLLILNYSSSLEFVLPWVFVSWSNSRRAKTNSLVTTIQPSVQPGETTRNYQRAISPSTLRTQPTIDSSRVKPRSVVSWHYSLRLDFCILQYRQAIRVLSPLSSPCPSCLKVIHSKASDCLSG